MSKPRGQRSSRSSQYGFLTPGHQRKLVTFITGRTYGQYIHYYHSGRRHLFPPLLARTTPFPWLISAHRTSRNHSCCDQFATYNCACHSINREIPAARHSWANTIITYSSRFYMVFPRESLSELS